MGKKNKYFLYVIIGLFLLLLLFLLLVFLSPRTIEGLSKNEDDFVVVISSKLYNKLGRVIPYPMGSYTVTTSSGKYEKTVDFSLNEPAFLTTNYDIDASKNIVNRIITITPKKTLDLPYCLTSSYKNCNPNEGDVIQNRFDLDISFNQMEYTLNSMADLKAKDLPADKMNYIDSSNNLIITGIGTIYDASRNKIGMVSLDSTDMNNQKSFNIKMQNPSNTYFNIQQIIITFTIPVPLSAIAPPAPPPIDPTVLSRIPTPDPNVPYKY